MRTVKTAVAVMLSYLVFVPFGLLYREELGGIPGQVGPLYACIACIVCMQSSLGQTMQQGISRFIGVAVGGVLGVLALALGETASYPPVKALLLGVVCVAGIWLCLLIHRPAACGMACIVPCVILVNDMTGVERYYYAAARIIETVVGVAIAFGVNAVLPDHRPEEPAPQAGGADTGGMNLVLRPERPGDRRAVEELTREAFWNVHTPGCCEHYLAHILRDHPDFIPELDLVAETGQALLGNIMYTRAKVVLEDGGAREVLCFGPLSVHPGWQGKGVGGALVRCSLELAREMGHQAVLIYGDPRYYSRFGFRPAETWGIRNAEGRFADALQGVELCPGGLEGLDGGCFLESPAFHVGPEDCETFDRGFPAKETGWAPTQERLRELADKVRDPQ